MAGPGASGLRGGPGSIDFWVWNRYPILGHKTTAERPVAPAAGCPDKEGNFYELGEKEQALYQ